jgi:hypothetical protein
VFVFVCEGSAITRDVKFKNLESRETLDLKTLELGREQTVNINRQEIGTNVNNLKQNKTRIT